MSIYPDISHHHHVTDWAALKESCPFLISKATQGTSYVDLTLEDFIKQCEARKIPYWLFAYLNKGNELAQAKFMVSTCKGKVGEYFRGYILDVEAGNAAEDVKEALRYIESLSVKVMVYTMYSQYDTYKSVIEGRNTNTAWWEARYGKNDGTYSSKYPPHDGVDLHQYTDVGKVTGLTGNIDLNRLTGNKAESWFTEGTVSKKKKVAKKETAAQTAKTGYSGTFPALPEPARKYYKNGDGITTLTNYPTQIKRVQMLVNWITGLDIKVDGKYGDNTETAVRAAQKILGVTVDGKFGAETLAAAKAYVK